MRITLFLQSRLVRALSRGNGELVDDLHTLLHHGNRCEALTVQVRIVLVVEEDLTTSRVRAPHGEAHVATLVALPDRVVFDGAVPPLAIDLMLQHIEPIELHLIITFIYFPTLGGCRVATGSAAMPTYAVEES